jgi:NAD(P)-dependent dehydrogenase (short-subunit alcohol dehydrogenase family)
MKNKVCLVTGGTSGIGFETALALANMGAIVVIGSRDMERASNAVIKIRMESNNPNVDFLLADLSDFVEVKRFAEGFKQQYKRLDVLVNNAGGIFREFDLNPQDIELTMSLNLYGVYLLTGHLLDILQKSSPSRIINVSSTVHRMVKNQFERFNNEQTYNGLNAYATSKLALLHFNYGLAEKLQNTGVVVNAMHPGWVKSNFGSGFYTGFYGIINTLFKPIQISPKKGAATIIYLATSPQVEKITGKYFVKQKAVASSPASYDKRATQYVWQLCEQTTGFTYQFKEPDAWKKEETEIKGTSNDKPVKA